MKRILFIMLLLIVNISLLLAENAQLQEISLNEMLTEYLPDYKIEKEIQLEGVGRDFAVAKETGDIVAVTANGDKFIIYFINKQGIELWRKQISKEYLIECNISKNGKTICINIGKEEGRMINIVFDYLGNIIYEKNTFGSYLIPSPNGNYLYVRYGGVYSSEVDYFVRTKKPHL